MTQEQGFNLSLLKTGTVIIVHTKHSVYRLKFLEAKEVEISGGMLANGELRFPTPQPAIFIGSLMGESAVKMDWIGNARNLEFLLGNKRFVTSKVQNVEIESPDGWSYSMEWDN